jgi:hypothetical protein
MQTRIGASVQSCLAAPVSSIESVQFEAVIMTSSMPQQHDGRLGRTSRWPEGANDRETLTAEDMAVIDKLIRTTDNVIYRK